VCGDDGLDLARTVELSGYPGPQHVLALADALALSEEQRVAVQTLFDRMQAEAVAVGTRLIDRYTALAQAVRDESSTTEALIQQTAEIGQLCWELQETHLQYHLLTRPLLTAEQLARYGRYSSHGAAGTPTAVPR
jgi:hypothetical protein